MADNRTFTLIGQFDDKITSHLNSINSTLNTLKRNLNSFGAKRGGFDDLNKSIGKTVGAHKILSAEVKSLRSEFSSSIIVMREYRAELGKLAGVKIGLKKASSGMNAEAAYWRNAAAAAARYNNTVSKGAGRSVRQPSGGGGGGRGGVRPTGGGGGGGYRGSVVGDVISGGLITNAIVSGFQTGVNILEKGMSQAFGAFAERARDQLEDVSAAGGIYSAFKYNKIPGQQAKSFQQAMEMQDSINKDMAAIASNLPGTTHNYVENSRRLVDTTGQVMSKDFKGMMDLAKKFTGNQKISMEEAFTSVNVEIAKSTTLLEKMNPSRTVVPMTQIVEDMIKKEEVSIAGLRKYVAFRRGTTFEAALQRHIKELNATGQGTAKRLEVINKILKEAVPAPMVNAFATSIAGVTEGFRSAFLDPDVGIFGLSRNLFQTVTKYNRETGEKIGTETANFFKIFAETFGNLGNLINTSILPGIAAVYSPFEAIAKDLEKLRDYSFKIFKQQQQYTQYYQELADKFGMSNKSFKTIEKGSLTTMMDVLRSFNMLSEVKYDKYAKMMSQGGSEKEISDSMRKIYQDLIPTILNSPFFKNIGKEIGKMLATVFKEIASIMKALLTGKYGVNEFADAFRQAGGMKAVNDIIVMLAEMIGKVILGIAELYLSSLRTAVKDGNFGAAAVLGVGGAVAAAPLLGPLIGGAANVAGRAKAAAAKASGGKALQGVKRTINPGKSLRDRRTISGKSAGFRQTSAENMRSGASKSASFRAIPTATRANPLFPNTALPGGVLPGVGGVTGPFKSPSLPKNLVKPPKIRGAGKMGAASAAINGVFAFNNAVAGTGNVLKKVVKTVGKAGIAFTALDFGVRVASGENAGTAALGAGGALAGGAIGAVVGQALLPFLPGIGGIIGSIVGAFLGDWVATQLPALFANFPAKMTAAFTAVSTWFNEAPAKFGVAVGTFIADVQIWFEGLPQAFSDWLVKFKASLNKLLVDLSLSWDKFIVSISTGGAIDWNKLGVVLAKKIEGAMKLAMALVNPVNMAAEIAKYMSGAFKPGQEAYQKRIKEEKERKYYEDTYGTFAGSPGKQYSSLGGAISSEMRNKPSGSNLVIANSSETVIPAAGGLGMDGLIQAIFGAAQSTASTITQGFTALNQTTAQGDQSIVSAQKQTAAQTQQTILKSTQAQLAGQQQLMSAIQASSMGGMGGLGAGMSTGAGYGGAGGQIAGQLGNFIKQTGGAPGSIHEHPQHGGVKYKHSPNSYHYQGRAIDIGGYANEQGGILRRVAQFNAKYGVKPVELFHAGNDPKGHSDHVHVAYALGAGNPAFFGSQSAAQSWEKSMIPGSMKVGSVTSNSSEGFGGQYSISNNITIQQQPGQDANALAAIVVQKMSEWVSDARSSSIFV